MFSFALIDSFEPVGRTAMNNAQDKRTALLLQLENMIGAECYNKNIQNWGPNGSFYGEGREFRYPVTFIGADGQLIKKRTLDTALPAAVAKTGFYAFGANQLQIIRGLEKVLEFLEKHHGLKV